MPQDEVPDPGVRDKTVMIMAGGTGGHVFPALAIARQLVQQGLSVNWLATPRGMEQRLAREYPLHTVSVSALRGRGPRRVLQALWQFCQALAETVRLFRRLRPAVVLGMGGYASAAGGVAARLLGIPLLIHEQNTIAGTTNRLLAPLATRVLHAFPGTFRPGRQVLCTGNPLSEALLQLYGQGHLEKTPASGAPLHLLVLGGSQGAASLNRWVPEALAQIRGPVPLLVHQTGPAHLDETREEYRQRGIEATLVPFIDDMAARYRWADLVLCRAGAMTVSELSAAGTASILVPFPYASDDHQTVNARYLSEHGAAVLLQEAGLSPGRLASELAALLGDRRRLQQMGRQARLLCRIDASRLIAGQCQGLIRD